MADNVYDPDADKQPLHKHLPANELANQEEQAGSDSSASQSTGMDPGEQQKLYNPDKDAGPGDVQAQASVDKDTEPGDTQNLYNDDTDKPSGVRARLRSARGRLSKLAKNKWLVGGLFGGGAAIVGLILLFVLLIGSLKIPDLAEHIASYQFARLARNYSEHVGAITAEDTALSTADKSALQKAADTLANVKDKTWGSMWDKINNYRPNAILDNLQESGRLQFEYSRTPGNLWKKKVTAVVLDGQRIEVGTSTWNKYFKPFQNRTARLELSDAMNEWIANTMQGRSVIIRGAVAKALRERTGILLKWWRQVDKFNGKDQVQADGEQAKEADENIAGDQKPVGAVTDSVSSAEDAGENAIKDCLDKPACAEQAAADGGVAAEQQSIVSSLTSGILKKVADWLSPLTAFVPACLIYDGSLDSTNAAQQMDANSTTDQRAFYAVESAADQQKFGDTTGEAVGAMNDKLGDIQYTIPERRASGIPVDTSTSDQAPQQSATGDYTSIADALPGPLADFINSLAHPICPIISSVWFNVAAGALSLIPGSVAIGSAAKEGLRATLASFFEKYLTKEAVKGLIKRGGIEVGKLGSTIVGVGAATLFASWIVHNKLVAHDTALATGTSFDEAADAGGNLHANELAREFYGRPLTCSEVADMRSDDTAYQTSQLAEQSTFQRYFALSNPDSLVTRVGLAVSARANHDTIGSVLTSASQIFNPGSFLHLINPFKTANAFADTASGDCDNQDYGNVQWGWSNEEENLIKAATSTEPNESQAYSYQPIDNQAAYEQAQFCIDYYTTDGCHSWKPYSDVLPGFYNICFGYDASGKPDPNATMGRLLTGYDDSGNGGSDQILLKRTNNGDIVSSGNHFNPASAYTTSKPIYNSKGKVIGQEIIIDPSKITISGDYCNPTELGDNNTEEFGGGTPIGAFNKPLGDIVFRYRLEKNYELTMDQLEAVQNGSSSDSSSSSSSDNGQQT